MAVETLQPGMGGRVTQTLAVVRATSTYPAIELDMSRCAQFAVQIGAQAGSSITLQCEQTFDGTNYVALGTGLTVAAGAIKQFDITDGPFGRVRFKFTSAAMAGGSDLNTFTVAGFPVQWSW